MVKDLEGKAYQEWLRSLGPFSLEQTSLQLQLPGVAGRGEAGTDLCTHQ